jgi:hypothetical protein
MGILYLSLAAIAATVIAFLHDDSRALRRNISSTND